MDFKSRAVIGQSMGECGQYVGAGKFGGKIYQYYSFALWEYINMILLFYHNFDICRGKFGRVFGIGEKILGELGDFL